MAYGVHTEFVYVSGLYVWMEPNQCQLGNSIVTVNGAFDGYSLDVFPQSKMAELLYVSDFSDDMVVGTDYIVFVRCHCDPTVDGIDNMYCFSGIVNDYYCDAKKCNVKGIKTQVPYLRIIFQNN